jgi:uncharacterized Zn finger protein
LAWYTYGLPKSMTVGERRAKALRAAEMLGRKQKLDPVFIQGSLASTWWGRAWNRNLEGYADYSNRLPRGRSYARHGSVIDLRIDAGSVTALVQGSGPSPYQVNIAIETVSPAARKALAEACSGKLESAEALLGGGFPVEMERLLTAEKTGLFPHPRSIRFSCSCPDSAALCKHVAAALYGVGSRLDRDPSLFFRLRKVEMEDLVSRAVKEEARKLLRTEGTGESARLGVDDAGLGALFGIDLEAYGKHAPASSVPIREKGPGPKGRGRRKIAGKQGNRTEATWKKIQSAMDSIDALAAELAGFETELKSIVKSGPRRKSRFK